MNLYCSKLRSGEILCIFPATSTWMHSTESKFRYILSRFGADLKIQSIDRESDQFIENIIGSENLGSEGSENLLNFMSVYSNENEQPDERTAFRNPIVSLTNRCFLKCSYCYVSSPSFTKDKFQTLDSEYVTRFIDRVIDIADGEVFSVQYFGGEPTMHDELHKLINQTRKRNLQARISTNGVSARIRSAQYRSSVEDAGVEWRISLDSVDRETNDLARGRGTFDAVMKNIEYLHGLNANISLKPVINKNNICNLEAYLEFAYSLKFKVTYGTMLPVGDALRNGIKREVNEFDVVRHLIEILSRKPYLIPTIELSPLGWTLKSIFLRKARALPRFTLYLHDDGFVYPMDGMIESKFRIGTADNLEIEKLVSLQKEYGLNSLRCKKCYLHGFCYTGDYHELRARDPSMQGEFYACNDRRNIYTLLMKEADKFHNIARIMLTSDYTQ